MSDGDNNSSLEGGNSPATLSRLNEQNPKLMNHLTIFECSPTMMREHLVARKLAAQHAPSMGDHRPDSCMMLYTPTLNLEEGPLDTVISSHGPIDTKEEGKASVIMVQKCALESEDMEEEDEEMG